MTSTTEMTIRDIVANDFRTAAVFQRHGIDFCCKGNRTIQDACSNGHVTAGEVLKDIAEVTSTPASGGARPNSWDLSTLASYIVANHHAFVREAIPVLLTHTKKVAAVHGDQHPELREVAKLFNVVADEMTSHMSKEEEILFPYIMELEEASQAGGGLPSAPFGTVRNPIRMMEMEHEAAGDSMARIRSLTAGYAIPVGACTTYRVCLQELVVPVRETGCVAASAAYDGLRRDLRSVEIIFDHDAPGRRVLFSELKRLRDIRNASQPLHAAAAA